MTLRENSIQKADYLLMEPQTVSVSCNFHRAIPNLGIQRKVYWEETFPLPDIFLFVRA